MEKQIKTLKREKMFSIILAIITLVIAFVLIILSTKGIDQPGIYNTPKIMTHFLIIFMFGILLVLVSSIAILRYFISRSDLTILKMLDDIKQEVKKPGTE